VAVRVGGWRTEDAAARVGVRRRRDRGRRTEDAAARVDVRRRQDRGRRTEDAGRRGGGAGGRGRGGYAARLRRRKVGDEPKRKRKNRIVAALYKLDHRLIRCGRKRASV
jgi:hypothetical protein